MEPKTLPNQIFEQFWRLFFSERKFASFFCSFVAEFVCFCKSRPLKFMRPRSVSLTSTLLGMFWKKLTKIVEKFSRNPPQIEQKSRKKWEKSKKNHGKAQDEWGKPKTANKMRKKCEKSPNVAPRQKKTLLDGIRETLSLLRKELKPSVTYENPFK